MPPLTPPNDPWSPRPLLTPIFQSTPCPWSLENPRHDHQLIFPLAGGRLLLVWSEYYASKPSHVQSRQPGQQYLVVDHMPCRLSARISGDAGRSWGAKFTLQDNHWPINVKHPNLLRLPSGEILFTFTAWSDFGRQRDLMLKRSSDELETWSPITRISAPGWHCQNNDHIFMLKSGRIVLPGLGGPGFVFSWGKGAAPIPSFALLSDDQGRSWRYSSDTLHAPGRGAEEPTMIELDDGTLLCLFRTTMARAYRCYSHDGGDHWTTPEPTELPSPDAPQLLKRIPTTGDLLLLWNCVDSNKGIPRTPLTAAISRDQGRSWERFVDLDQRPDGHAAYPAVTFLGSQALITYYSCPPGWPPDSEVMLKIYEIEQFYR